MAAGGEPTVRRAERKRAEQAAELRADLDIANTADAVTGMFVGATIRALRSDLGPEARRDMFAAHVRLLLDGVRAR
jgi:hypothetical protein